MSTGLLLPVPAITDKRKYALFLDLDGTLLEIADHPDAVDVDVRIHSLLASLQSVFDGALALISGRTIEAIDTLLQPLHLAAAGQHGLERRAADGRIQEYRESLDDIQLLRSVIAAVAKQHPMLSVEDKGLTMAVHFRRAPQLEAELYAQLNHAVEAADGRLKLQAGKMVLEVKPSGRNKGVAINEFLSEAPFIGRCPIFIGDDLTDEFGFTVVNTQGGISVKVGPGVTVANHRLENVAAVRSWLEQLASLSTTY